MSATLLARLQALPSDDRDVALRELPGMLSDSGNWPDLRWLLTSLGFIELKLRRFGLDALLDDVDRYVAHAPSVDADDFEALAGSLRLSGTVLRQSPEQLAQHLAARLIKPSPQALEPLIQEAHTALRSGGLIALRPSMIQGGHRDLDALSNGDGIKQLRVLLDGKRFVTLSENRISIWSLPLRGDSRLLSISCADVASFAVSRDGTELFALANSGALVVWEIETGFELRRTKIECDAADAIEVLGERLLAILDRDGAIAIDAKTLEPVRRIDLEVPNALAASPRGVVLAGCIDGVVELVDLQGSAERTTVGWHGSYKNQRLTKLELFAGLMAATPLYAASGGSLVDRIDLKSAINEVPNLTDSQRNELRESISKDPLREQVNFIAPDRDGNRLVASACENHEVALIDLDERRVLRRFRAHTSGVRCCDLASRHKRLVSASSDGTVRMWDMETGTPLDVLRTAGSGISGVSFIEEGRRVLIATDEGELLIWRGQQGRSSEPTFSRAPVEAVSFIGSRVLTIARAEITSWSLPSSSALSTRQYHEEWGSVRGLTPDGRRAISTTSDAVVVWDVSTGWPLGTIELHAKAGRFGRDERTAQVEAAVTSDLARAVVYVQQGLISATIGNESTLQLWDLTRGRCLHNLDAQAGLIHKVIVSADGRWAVTRGQRRLSVDEDPDGPNDFRVKDETRLWDLSEGTCIWEDTSATSCVAFDPSASHVVWRVGDQLQRRAVSRDAVAQTIANVSTSWSEIRIAGEHVLAINAKRTMFEVWERRSWRRCAAMGLDAPITAIEMGGTTVIIGDNVGGVHFFGLPAAQPAHGAPADAQDHARGGSESGQATSDAGAGHSPTAPANEAPVHIQLDEAASFEASGRPADAVRIWKHLGRSQGTSAPLRVRIADHLRAMGELDTAAEVFLGLVSDASMPVHTRLAAVDALSGEHLATALEVAGRTFANGPSQHGEQSPSGRVMCAVCESLIANNASVLHDAVRNEAIPELARIAIGHALGRVDRPAAAAFLRHQSVGAETTDGRILALEGLRHITPVTDWLETLTCAIQPPVTMEVDQRIALLRMVNAVVRAGNEAPSGAANEGRPWYELRLISRYQALNNGAMVLASANRYDDALELLATGIRMFPADPRLYLNRAGVLIRQKRYDEGIKDATKVLSLDAQYAKALNFRSFAFIQTEQYELALEDIERSLLMSPGDMATLMNRAACLRALGRNQEAERDDREVERLRQWSGETRLQSFERTERPQLIEDVSDFVTKEDGKRAADMLSLLGSLDAEIESNRRIAQRNDLSSMARRSAIEALAKFGATSSLAKVVQASETYPETRVWAAAALLHVDDESDAPLAHDAAWAALTPIATAPELEQRVRQEAASVIAEHASIDRIETVVRRVTDLQAANGDVAPGVPVVLILMKALGQRNDRASAERIAADPSMPGWARELAGEIVGAHFDRDHGIALLEAIARANSVDAAVRKQAAAAIEHFKGRKDESYLKGPAISVEAFKEFLAAPDLAAVEALVQGRPYLTDPEFIENIEHHLQYGACDDREALRQKLEHLRSLPADPRQSAFRSFARAMSPEQMQIAVTSFPVLTLPEFLPDLIETIERDVPEGERPAHRKRLEWLRAIPVDKLQAALQAFANVETAEDLQAVVEAHPTIRTQEFRQVLAMATKHGFAGVPLETRLTWLDALGPDPLDAEIDAAWDAMRDGRPRDALLMAERVNALDPTRRTFMLRGLALMDMEHVEQAIAVLSQGIAENPGARMHEMRGKAFMVIHRVPEAVADFTQALKLDPDMGAAYLGRGIAYTRLDNLEGAASDLEEAFARAPQDELAAFTLAMVNLQLGNTKRIRMILDSIDEWSLEFKEQVDMLRAAVRGTDEDSREPEEFAFQEAFEALMSVRSRGELAAALSANPVMADPDFHHVVEAQIEAHRPEDRAGMQHRLRDLLLILHPEQRAVDALMSAEGNSGVKTALQEHPLLGNKAFREHLTQMCETLEPGQAQYLGERLRILGTLLS